MNPTNETPLQLEDVGIGRLFWIVRDAVVGGEAESGLILLWSPAAEQMFGYSAAEAVGQSIELLVPAHLREAHRSGLRHYQQTGHGHLIDRGVPIELQAMHKSGEMRWIELSLNPVEAPVRRAHLVLAIIRDATARRQVQDAQRVSAQAEALAAERSAILDQIAEGVIITDPQGRITFANAAARRIHGTGELGVGGDHYAAACRLRKLNGQLYPDDELPLTRAVQSGESVLDARWRVERPDGTEIIAEGSATPVVGVDGTPLGSVLLMHDVTCQAALEPEKDDFFTAVSHDLKNPLTAVQGTAQLLRSEAAEPNGIPADRLAARLVSIESASKRMRAMLDQLADMARVSLARDLDLNRSAFRAHYQFQYGRVLNAAGRYAEAAQLYWLAAQAGDRSTASSLAVLYQSGFGVTKDANLAACWSAVAAQPGSSTSVASRFGAPKAWIHRRKMC
jgi:PAS domain S-box-containing protein